MPRARPSKISRFAGLPTGESWLVVVGGEIRTLSGGELEAAFDAGEIDGATPVWTAGMATWEPLGVISSLEDGLPLENKSSRAASRKGGHGALPEPGTLGDPNAALWASMAPVPSITRVRRRVGVWSALAARTWGRLPRLTLARDDAARARQARWLPVIAGAVALAILAAWSIGARLAATASDESPRPGLSSER